MFVVDPRKLDAQREVIDSTITEYAILYPIGRKFFLEVLARQFGYRLEFFKVDDWCVVTAQRDSARSEIRLYETHSDWDRACELDIESRFEMSAIASSTEVAAIAIVLRMLDDQIDIFFTDDVFQRHYPGAMGDFPNTIAWRLEWYFRADVWYQDVPQAVSISDRDSVCEIAFGGWSS